MTDLFIGYTQQKLDKQDMRQLLRCFKRRDIIHKQGRFIGKNILSFIDQSVILHKFAGINSNLVFQLLLGVSDKFCS